MNQLNDDRREMILWECERGLSTRKVQEATGHSKGTVLKLAETFHSLVVTSGFKLREEFRQWDRYHTVVQLRLGEKLRRPAVNHRSSMPMLFTRAVLTQVRHDGKSQALLNLTLPFIRMEYFPLTRAEVLIREIRLADGNGPSHCRHCAGLYSHTRHEEICVRYGLA